MNAPIDFQITDWHKARELEGRISAGRHFLFVDKAVYPLVDEPIQLPGMTVSPSAQAVQPLAAVVASRDLYRAEEDTAHLLVVLPAEPERARLLVECDGQPFTERELVLRRGTALVPLAALMAGRYQAFIEVDGKRLESSAEFTVAEYGLAPLSARLLRHSADRAEGQLSFTLDVESWQQSSTEPLVISLLDDDVPVDSSVLTPSEPGRYEGTLRMEGDGPFRLQARVEADSGRIATVAIPGTRKAEREVTVFTRLGHEMLFSLLPEPSAMPLRGGYLGRGDRVTTPITVDAVVTESPSVELHADVSRLHFIVFDLLTGKTRVVDHGDASAGDSLAVENPTGLALVVVGGIVGGEPFEGFATFVRPSHLDDLKVSTPDTARPREGVTVTVETGAPGTVPVLLTVRDRRLTLTDTPSSGLGASLKRGVDSITEGMSAGIDPIQVVEQYPEGIRFAVAMEDLGSPLDAAGGVMMDMMGYEDGPVLMGMGEALEVEVLEEVFDAASPTSASEPAPPAPPADPRTAPPSVLFVGLIDVEGQADVPIWTGDGTGSFLVEAFVYDGGDWRTASCDLVVDQAVRADLELPPMARAGDDVEGSLRLSTASGRGTASLTRDGVAVELRAEDGALVDGELSTPAMLTFAVEPGEFLASVEDAESGERDVVEATVSRPGRLRSHARELILLTEGESISLEDASALSLSVLPGLKEPFELLVETTADYGHLCCEQTAAKILSATVMYLGGDDEEKRSKAEGIIRKGIAREMEMFRPGGGFSMYPKSPHVNDHYSGLAARYLWGLEGLAETAGLSDGLREAVVKGVAMADDAGAFHGLDKAPSTPATLYDAYAALSRGGDSAAALAVIDRLVDFSARDASLRNGGHAVVRRAGLAYAAAGLLAAGDIGRGLKAANAVVKQLGENGALYSTVDSVAAIALMVQLRLRSVLSGDSRVRVNGEGISLEEAVALSDRVESVECLAGTVAVEALALREEDWETYGADFAVRVGLREDGDRQAGALHAGQRVDLLVHLEEGYRVGDLVHVDLPACLSWLKGGGLVKRFTVDFEGEDEIRVPLAVTGRAHGGQHLAVCVRSMFEEERRANPGLIRVSTDPTA